MKKQYISRLLAYIHETAEGLHDTGVMKKSSCASLMNYA